MNKLQLSPPSFFTTNIVLIYRLMVIVFCMASALSITCATPYTIKNVEVQSQGSSSSEAKDKALKDAKRQAFQLMIQKMLNQHDLNRFDETDDQTIDFLVDSFQLSSEHMGPKSYKATVSFDFNKQRIEDFLRNKAVPFTVPVHKSILVLPVLSDGAKTYLFEVENTWLRLWREHSFNQALVTFVIPNGDLNDLNALDAEDAIIGVDHKIRSMSQRYQTSAVVVAYVTLTKEGRNLTARMDFQEFDAKGLKKNNLIRSHHVSELAADTSKQQLIEQLLPVAINNIQDFCKAQFGGSMNHNLVYLKVPTKSKDDYYKYIKLLEESAMAIDIKPVELSRNFSVLRVRTLYTLEDLINYFKERGYNFDTSQDVANPYAYEASSDAS